MKVQSYGAAHLCLYVEQPSLQKNIKALTKILGTYTYTVYPIIVIPHSDFERRLGEIYRANKMIIPAKTIMEIGKLDNLVNEMTGDLDPGVYDMEDPDVYVVLRFDGSYVNGDLVDAGSLISKVSSEAKLPMGINSLTGGYKHLLRLFTDEDLDLIPEN
jgi:hypothetical protein